MALHDPGRDVASASPRPRQQAAKMSLNVVDDDLLPFPTSLTSCAALGQQVSSGLGKTVLSEQGGPLRQYQALDTQRRRPLICNLLQDHYINYPVKASASQRKLGNSESLEMKDCMQGKFYFTRTNPSPSPSFEPKKEVPPRLRLKKKNSENQKAFFGNNITVSTSKFILAETWFDRWYRKSMSGRGRAGGTVLICWMR
eukprot:768651-Hanusia_phi.AAC.3